MGFLLNAPQIYVPLFLLVVGVCLITLGVVVGRMAYARGQGQAAVDKVNHFRFLREVEFFAQLSDQDKERLQAMIRDGSFPEGSAIFREFCMRQDIHHQGRLGRDKKGGRGEPETDEIGATAPRRGLRRTDHVR